MPVKTDLPANLVRIFYNIAPGEILLFENSSGLKHRTVRIISELNQLMHKYDREDYSIMVRQAKDYGIMVGQPDVLHLEDFIIARKSTDTENSYIMYISSINNLYGLLYKLWGVTPKRTHFSVENGSDGTEEPDEVWINADNSTTMEATDICDDCPYMSELDPSMSLISAKTPQTEEEMLAKLTELFEEAAYKGYDMAEIVNTLKKKYTENAAINYNEYGLRLDYEYTTADKTHLKRCDIYVKENDTPLQLSAIEKSTYLTYILFADGVKNVLSINFMKTLVDIYSMMADSSMKDFGGIASSKFYNAQTGRYEYNSVQSGTIIGYRNAIKDEINKHIKIKRIAQDFRIEGIKNKPFKVEKSTQELREQIRQIFHLK